MEERERRKVSVEPKRIRINEEIEQLLEEAADHPLIAEYDGNAYRAYAERVLPPSPYTIDTVYGSLPLINGGSGSVISNEELEAMIEAGKEENLRNIAEGMKKD